MVALISASAFPMAEVNNVNAHLEQYSIHTVTHHDNVDDSNESHSHTHKHSENGEEHEHEHEHSKFSFSVAKILYRAASHKMIAPENKPSLELSKSQLVPDSYPSEVFRPPIIA